MIGVFAKNQYEIVNLAEFINLLRSIDKFQTGEAKKHLTDLTDKPKYPPLEPIVYEEIRKMALVQQREWTDLQVKFLPYLPASQIAICIKIINHLKDIYEEGDKFDRSILKETEKDFLDRQLAPHVVYKIKMLISECLDLLETTSE
jgi:hypothetical protein